ncbi:MAG: DUF192 domain-containing protein [Elainellaceae cyanobacterium]
MVLCSVGLSLLVLGCAQSSQGSSPSSDTGSEPSTLSDSSSEVTSLPSTSKQTQVGQRLSISAQVMLGGEMIDLEVATTPRQQAIGLMFRPEIPANQGMLFPFAPPRPVNFWMRNVQVPLDMVFLRQGEIVAIAHSAPPCTTATCPTYGPDVPVDSVLELGGGRATELGLTEGDTIDIQFLDPDPEQASSP